MIPDVIRLDSHKQIRITRRPVESKPYRGHDVVDFRVWTKTRKGFRPSNQGVAFDAALLPRVLAALDAAASKPGSS
ncbi:hypothetical protein [Ruegeria jejuensis]|uniref:hypothetical protein n=1 Tax=Ruegeria jejuensis TaxID=3233338 RepID=UPI00355BDE79